MMVLVAVDTVDQAYEVDMDRVDYKIERAVYLCLLSPLGTHCY